MHDCSHDFAFLKSLHVVNNELQYIIFLKFAISPTHFQVHSNHDYCIHVEVK